jgi:L-iditol 2-dehydrogenase
MLPTSGLAAVLTEYGQPLEIHEVRIPEVEPGALLVEVELASVCGTDVHLWRGEMGAHRPFKPPLIPGHEGVGRIAAIGAGADRDSLGRALAIGDRVIWEHESCGTCEMCSVAREPAMCVNRRVGMFADITRHPFSAGTFAQYSYVWPKAGRVRVPDSVASDAAAAGSCALRTVVGVFDRLGPIDFNSRVLVQGSGPLGLFATALASWHHPRHLVVVGAPDGRLDLAREWGATTTISIDEHPDAEARRRLIEDATDGGPDVLIELAGAPTAFSEGVDVAARNARYAVAGSLSPGTQPVSAATIVGRGLRIIGCVGGDISTYERAMRFLEAGRSSFDWTQMFRGDPYSLAATTDALQSQRSGAQLKPLISPWK